MLTVRLGDTLQLVLFLNGIRVARALGGVDELVSQALGDRLDVTESGFAGTSAQQPNGLVHSTQWRHVNSLTTDGTCATDTSRIFSGTRVDDGIHQNLQRVLKMIQIKVNLCFKIEKQFNIKYLARKQVNDLEGVLQDADSHQFLAVVPAVHHQRVGHSLDDWALGLTETLGSVTASAVRQELGVLFLDGQIILEKKQEKIRLS